MELTMYGISNCDTIRKARKWLDEKAITYRFHDYRKEGIDEGLAKELMALVPLKELINRRSTTWRNLDEESKEKIIADDHTVALMVMLDEPTIIRRPLLVDDKGVLVGFSAEKYERFLNQQ